MAENDQSQEKTQEPTQRRLEKAREDGDDAEEARLTAVLERVHGGEEGGAAALDGVRLGEEVRCSAELQFSRETEPSAASQPQHEHVPVRLAHLEHHVVLHVVKEVEHALPPRVRRRERAAERAEPLGVLQPRSWRG